MTDYALTPPPSRPLRPAFELAMRRMAAALASDKSPAWRRWSGRSIAIGTVVGLVALGSGIAAAAGAFSSPPPVSEVWGPAHNLTQTANWTQPTEVTHVVASGPGGTTLLVGSSSGMHGTCEALAAKRSGEAKAMIVGFSCQGGVNTLDPTATIPGTTSTYSETTHGWTSATGTQYAMSFGQAPAGTASVAYGDASSTALVTGTVSNGWYVIAVPASDLGQGKAVRFYSQSGAPLGTGPASSAFSTS